MRAKLDVISIWLLVVSCLLLVSCARTVTQYVTYGDQMVVEVTLRGTMEAGANRYFMVLASSSNYKIPLPPPDNPNYDEFLEPGTEPKLGNIADYYTNYYSTWAGYIMVESGGYFLVDGPFVQGQVTTREPLSDLGEISSKIKFNFRLSQIFGSSIPSTIYFDFVSVPWPSDSSKLLADHLTSTNAYVSKVAGSTATIPDDPDDSLAPALDILKCTVTIQ